jgi:hypothetical protein
MSLTIAPVTQINRARITAADARKLTDAYAPLAEFYIKINDEASKGGTNISWRGAMSQEAQFLLTNDGYKIAQMQSACGSIAYTVSW